MKNKTHYRQGDVLIERVETIPAGLTRLPHGGPTKIILAHGEVTGHHHAVEFEGPEEAWARSADWWKSADGNEQFLDLAKPAKVTHQEHATVELPRGKYRVTRQREYTPEAIRNVAD